MTIHKLGIYYFNLQINTNFTYLSNLSKLPYQLIKLLLLKKPNGTSNGRKRKKNKKE